MNFFKGVLFPARFFNWIASLDDSEINKKHKRISILVAVFSIFISGIIFITPTQLTGVSSICSFLSTNITNVILIWGIPLAILIATKIINSALEKLKLGKRIAPVRESHNFKSLAIMNVNAAGFTVIDLFLLSFTVPVALNFISSQSSYFLLLISILLLISYCIILIIYPAVIIAKSFKVINEETGKEVKPSWYYFAAVLVLELFIILITLAVSSWIFSFLA
ncbi:hypothetical protein [Photobacterium kishitanii]|uniref:Uncharacterized protein n=1 Tax=Photobacterium kishitanii TaxID=318456 RepID=A0A2T3KM90_9GAMM|nr:hypothetical protein [Photobacterium kishitanii]PSV00865.1 hypothetical protein C9J27_02230 [Photobacterium kishitanii]